MLATKEVQIAIYNVLTSYGLAVHSSLPINTKLPYVQFSSIQLIDAGNKTSERHTYYVSLSAWCIDSTAIDIHEIASKIINLKDEELDLGEEFSHDDTRVEVVTFSKEIINNEVVSRVFTELAIDVSKN